MPYNYSTGTYNNTHVSVNATNILANNSTINGNNNHIIGNNNLISGIKNVVNGNNNDVKGNNNTVTGNNNTVKGKDNTVQGNNCINKHTENGVDARLERMILLSSHAEGYYTTGATYKDEWLNRLPMYDNSSTSKMRKWNTGIIKLNDDGHKELEEFMKEYEEI